MRVTESVVTSDFDPTWFSWREADAVGRVDWAGQLLNVSNQQDLLGSYWQRSVLFSREESVRTD